MTATNIYKALLEAQKAMGPALKTSANPAFKSKYADLSAVQDACFPALHANGFAVFWRHKNEAEAEYVETVLAHEGGQEIATRIPLIIGKRDMQGYGSAVTYARRYGLMSLAGIAPEDDDGNSAAKNPQTDKRMLSSDQFRELRDLLETSGSDEGKFCAFFQLETLEEMPAGKFPAAIAMLRKKIDAMEKADA
jgi:hypothetical protein